MNVWVVTTHDPIPGIDTSIRTLRYGLLSESLLKKGHSVVMWTSDFAHWNKQNRQIETGTIDIRPGFTAEFLKAKPYYKNRSINRIAHNRRIAKSFRLRTKCYTQLPDIIIAEIPCLELAEAAAQFAKANKIPFVVDIQDVWPDVYLFTLPKWLATIGRLFLVREYARLKNIVRNSTGVTAVSHTYLKWATQKAGRSIEFNDRTFELGYSMPNNATNYEAISFQDSFLKNYHITKDMFVISFLGQFGHSYDLNTVIAAASILKQDCSLPQHRFVLAGNGDSEPQIKKLASNVKSVLFTGWLNHAGSVALMNSSDLALAAYSSRALQSLPYKPFEYMAYGLPILNSLKGELAELINREFIGTNYQSGDPRSLARAIRRFMLDPEYTLACSRRSSELFKLRFESDIIYTSMVSYLESIVYTYRTSR